MTTDGFPRLLDRVTAGRNGCVVFTGALEGGYSRVYHFGKRVLGHRLAYERRVGPIPAGLQLDHLCRNRACVNPSHLEPVTNRENTLRGDLPSVNRERCAASVSCIRGHEWGAGDFTITKRGTRRCRACDRVRQQERRAA
jgi:hypothetical protein